ncbi:hypothetical protein RHGRI_036021 [Rhododendron griersonianum]|uniref:Enoyl reductase (ER) domain-containing protein n=1 Tax=Rhododendron griersonianum TaxID=479676 RepID=A0AAV6HLF3_9ERIC|nr:hypothetical protein RHGRI_036021 [Rhododendron griersonianum]
MGRPPEHFMGYVHLYSSRVLDIMSEQDGCNSNGHVEVPVRAPKKDEVLIKVEAASLNPFDWKMQKGVMRPILPSKFPYIPVADLAGEVVEVGFRVKKFKPGDKVVAFLSPFSGGGLAEFAVAKENLTVPRAEAAGLPIAGLTAHQALTQSAGVKLDGSGPRKNLLITAASGGVGHYAVQLAKLGNTHMTATCGAHNLDFVKGLGADEVLDYRTPDGAALKSPSGQKYDVVIHCATGTPFSAFEPNLSPNGKVIDMTLSFGSFMTFAVKKLTCSKKQLVTLLVVPKRENLDYLVQLLKSRFKPSHVHKPHPFSMFSSTPLPSPPNQTVPTPLNDTVHHISSLITQPNWEQSNRLKSLVSHMPPHLASDVIARHSSNVELGVRFFTWVCKQSTYCYDFHCRFHLLKLMVFRNLFVVAHKAVVFLIKECSCNGEVEIVKLMGALDEMREVGFRLNYPSYSTLLMCLAKLSMGRSAFFVYRRMVDDGFVVGIVDYRSIVNALCKNAFVRAAEMVLSRILRVGFRLDVHICSSLVLGSCRLGDLKEAFRVFDIMSEQDGCNPNGVTYSVLIHGICEAGEIEEAFQLKEEMSEKGCQPSVRTYTVLIKALCDIGLTDKALGLLDEMVVKGCKPNNHTYTVLIDRLCGEGKIQEANGMFRKMLKDGLFPGIVTYNALINGYCKEGRVVSAFELLSVMERRNCRPRIRTYNELMEVLCIVNKPYKAMLLLRRVIDNGLLPDRVSYNILIDGFCKEGQLRMAFDILKSMEALGLGPDGLTCTAVIDGLCKQGRTEEASGVLGLMTKKGISPDEVTLTALIDGYCKIGEVGTAFMLFERMVDRRCLTSPHIFNLFLDVLSKQTRLNETNAMVGKMFKYGLVPSVVTYTILIDGLCRVGCTKDSFNMVELMKQGGCLPNVYTYTVVIHGLCQLGGVEEAHALLFKMPLLGLSPNHITYTILVQAHVKSGRLDCAIKIVSSMVRSGIQPNNRIYHVLLAGFVMSGNKEGALSSFHDVAAKYSLITKNDGDYFAEHVFREIDIGDAFELLDKIKECVGSTVELHNSLAMGLCKVGRMSDAGHLVQDMVIRGLVPDKSVCSLIIKHFCEEKNFDYCLGFMKLILDNGFIPSISCYCSLILGLRHEGKVQEAQRLVCDLFRYANIEEKAAVSPYIEFLVKEDEPFEFRELLRQVEQMYQNERPII